MIFQTQIQLDGKLDYKTEGPYNGVSATVITSQATAKNPPIEMRIYYIDDQKCTPGKDKCEFKVTKMKKIDHTSNAITDYAIDQNTTDANKLKCSGTDSDDANMTSPNPTSVRNLVYAMDDGKGAKLNITDIKSEFVADTGGKAAYCKVTVGKSCDRLNFLATDSGKELYFVDGNSSSPGKSITARDNVETISGKCPIQDVFVLCGRDKIPVNFGFYLDHFEVTLEEGGRCFTNSNYANCNGNRLTFTLLTTAPTTTAVGMDYGTCDDLNPAHNPGVNCYDGVNFTGNPRLNEGYYITDAHSQHAITNLAVSCIYDTNTNSWYLQTAVENVTATSMI